MEYFSKPAAGGIIERTVDGVDYILIQERHKDNASEKGLIEIPAGKVREFESVYECLRREIFEETGLEVIAIDGEDKAEFSQSKEYKVLSYIPFTCAQNIEGKYPIQVEIFICRTRGEILNETNETQNIRWVTLAEINEMLKNDEDRFYAMHITTLKKYIDYKLSNNPL